jgi:hypothetical protein
VELFFFDINLFKFPFLFQTQTKVWLGEVLNLRFDEDISVADLLSDGEIL